MSQSHSSLPPTNGSTLTPTRDTSLADIDYSTLTAATWTNESDWLNSILSSTIPRNTPADMSLTTIEHALTDTVHSLELTLHDTSTQLDRAIADITTSVPRLTFDLQLMRENALLLRFTLDAIRKRSTGFGKDSPVGTVLERMRVLDLVKTRMEAARDVLREAESWSTLESEVTGLVAEDGQYLKAAERLAEAARSMVVFQNTAEYEARRALMVSLQNQLEQNLSSGLLDAIRERDVKACKTMWNIFGMIQREQEFRSYYFGSKRSRLIEGWIAAQLVDCVDESPSTLALPPVPALPSSTSDSSSTRFAPAAPQKFSTFLVRFYAELFSLLTEERTYLPAIFPDPIPTLSAFIETTLEGLSPSFPQRLHSITESYGPAVLPELIVAFKATEEFAVQVETIFAKLEPPTQPSVANIPGSPSPTDTPTKTTRSTSISSNAASPMTPTKHRRMSKRRSLSKRISARSISYALGSNPEFVVDPDVLDLGDGEDDLGASAAVVRAWETALYEPFFDLQVEYPSLERQYLTYEIERNIVGRNPSDWIDPTVTSFAATDRTGTPVSSSSSTQTGPKVLLERVNKLFGLFEDAIGRNLGFTHGYAARGLVSILDEQFVGFLDHRKEDLVQVSRRRVEANQRRRQGGTGSIVRNEDDLGLYADDDRNERRGEDDMVLEGLEYSSQDWETFQFGLRLLDACRSMGDKLHAFEGKLRSRMIMLNHSVKQAREHPSMFTIPGTTKGQILLLRQSTLNSVELATMLEGLEGGRAAFLLPRSKGATTEFTRTTQLFLHETILAPLLSHLGDYATLACWTTTSDRTANKGAFDLSIPTFSLSPTETISRVGEGLFNLPRLFEVYAQDDALAYSIETLPFVDVEALRALQHPEPPPMLRQTSSSGHRPTLSEVNNSSRSGGGGGGSGSHRSSISQLPSTTTPASVAATPLSAETVIATWLSSLTLSILSHLTVSILPSLTRLTKPGAAQLVSDLDYISNVARALDVESPDELEAWREAVAMDEKALREGGGGSQERESSAIFERVARLRGLRRG
ncbi:uncharacterized protein JCM15063_002418 [Sporobolomyces koalae]|uniref:uncharacterized protein n=1 Tax=Sporobolomyces koalae TaxID=500713 RepID=UPI003179714E